MRNTESVLLIGVVPFILFLAMCVPARAEWTGEPLPSKIKMLTYSGLLQEPAAPTSNDQKLWIEMAGQSARDVYKQLKKERLVQTEVNGVTVNQKVAKGLNCRSGKSTKDYRCVFQMDLITGQVLQTSFSEDLPLSIEQNNIKSVNASYLIYTGELPDISMPRVGQAKLALYIDGPVAYSLFKVIGPDEKRECMPEDDPFRSRSRLNRAVVCMVYAKTQSSRCAVGLDLEKIKPTYAITC